MTQEGERKVKWGILSTGSIANNFVKSLQRVNDAVVFAVASRDLNKANEFADKYNIQKRYGSYEELAQDPEIDIIYIATPHIHHKDNAILCLNNNKSVLVEKAFTLNSKEAKQVVDLAKEKNLFVMEAMWTRFFPATKKVKELLANKTIGEIHYVTGDLSFNAEITNRADPKGRYYNKDLAGGALLDVGIYPISLASHILGAQPISFDTTVVKAATGVDESFTFFAKYESGATAFISGSFNGISTREFVIVGSLGYIKIPTFTCPSKVIVKIKNDSEQVIDFPWPSEFPSTVAHNGLVHEAEAVTEYIKTGKKESDIISPHETVAIMQTLDSMRARWGISYPGEI